MAERPLSLSTYLSQRGGAALCTHSLFWSGARWAVGGGRWVLGVETRICFDTRLLRKKPSLSDTQKGNEKTSSRNVGREAPLRGDGRCSPPLQPLREEAGRRPVLGFCGPEYVTDDDGLCPDLRYTRYTNPTPQAGGCPDAPTKDRWSVWARVRAILKLLNALSTQSEIQEARHTEMINSNLAVTASLLAITLRMDKVELRMDKQELKQDWIEQRVGRAEAFATVMKSDQAKITADLHSNLGLVKQGYLHLKAGYESGLWSSESVDEAKEAIQDNTYSIRRERELRREMKGDVQNIIGAQRDRLDDDDRYVPHYRV